MDFSEFKLKLNQIVDAPLPGSKAHYKLAPVNREKLDISKLDISKVKRAAVAALFFNLNDSPHLVLTLRNTYPGVHSGQISFPGGKKEEGDQNFKETALRETCEEIGIAKSQITLHRDLSELYIPPSNFLVQPFLGTIDSYPQFIAEEKEVNKILKLDFNKFLDYGSIRDSSIDMGKYSMKVPAFSIEEYTIWGATAMMISELRELFLEE